MKVQRRTEIGDAPGWQRDEGAYRQYSTGVQRRHGGSSAGQMRWDFHYGLLAPDVPETLAGPETDGATGWDPDLLTGAGVATDAPFARLDQEHPEPA